MLSIPDNEEDRSVYRLYHEALAEYLRSLVDSTKVQRAITDTLLAMIDATPGSTERDWVKAHSYIRTHLVTHAAPAGELDQLIFGSLFV